MLAYCVTLSGNIDVLIFESQSFKTFFFVTMNKYARAFVPVIPF